MKLKSTSSKIRNKLIGVAKRAQQNAYCPYSHYAVGAAVLGVSGRIYEGCNVESPTLIANICAERAAIYHALSRGERQIVAVCTVSRASEPCGSCRQLIREFGVGDTLIYSVHSDPVRGKQKVVQTSIGRLLPRAHTVEMLSLENKIEPNKRP